MICPQEGAEHKGAGLKKGNGFAYPCTLSQRTLFCPPKQQTTFYWVGTQLGEHYISHIQTIASVRPSHYVMTLLNQLKT